MPVILPAVALAEPVARTGLALSVLMAEPSAPAGIVLSALFGDYTGGGVQLSPEFTEAIASTTSYSMSGGARVSGWADVALDPWIASGSGGVKVSGTATVTAIQVTITQVVMMGGTQSGGSAPVTYGWKEMAGSGGAQASGVAIVTTFSSQPSGGAKVSGSAVISDFSTIKISLTASGGAKVSGAANIVFQTLLSYQHDDMSGGAKVAGAALVDSVAVLNFSHIPAGGIQVSGAVLVAAISVLHHAQAMTGGAQISGTATAAVNWIETAMHGGGKVSGAANIGYYQRLSDGWSFNLNTATAAQYADFKFNSFCRIGENYYGCNEAGIFLLSGDTDNGLPINATITTGISDLSTEQFDGSFIKSMANAYCNAMSAQPMTLTCNVEGQSYTYTFSAATATVKPARVDIGRGLFGVNWQHEVKNVGGADFELDSLAFMPNSTKRRV